VRALGTFPRDEHPVAVTTPREIFKAEKKGKCEKWGEKICHSSSLGHSGRRSLRTVAFSGNSLPAYFRAATIQNIEVLGTDASTSGRTREKGMSRGGFLEK
jgi:hypothetical protein